MRTGKRWLAGVAAGALGAGALSFVAAPAAQAGAPVAIVSSVPSYTVVANWETAATALPIPLEVVDVNGDAVSASDAAGTVVRMTLTQPTTVQDDDSAVVGFTTTGLSGGTYRLTGTDVAPADYAGLASAGIRPVWLDSATIRNSSWASMLASGTLNVGVYTLTAQLLNAGSAAVISQVAVPIQVVDLAAAPAPTVTFVNNYLNPLNRYASSQGAVIGSNAPRVLLTNATGGPWIVDDTTSPLANNPVKLQPSSPALGLAAVNSGFTLQNSVYGTPVPGLYYADDTTGPGSNQWPIANSSSLVATVSAGSATLASSTLPVGLGSIASSVTATPTVSLTTIPSARINDTSYAVPPGTTDLTFGISTVAAYNGSTLAWNARSSDTTSGVITSSAGVAPIVGNSGSFSVKVAAAATTKDDTIAVLVGDDSSSNIANFEVVFQAPAPTVTLTAPIAKVGSATTISGTILDQYGAVLSGSWGLTLGAGSSCPTTTAGILAQTTGSATGTFSLTVPASASPTTATGKEFIVCANNGLGSTANDTIDVQYTANGDITSLSTTTDPASSAGTAIPLVSMPSDGVVDLQTLTTVTVAPTATPTSSQITSAGDAFEITATTTPAAAVTFTASEGAYVTSKTTGSLLWNAGVTTVTPTTPTVAVFALKPGLHTVTVTAGTKSEVVTFRAVVQPNTARTIETTTPKIDLKPSSFAPVTAVLKDVFGNPVPATNVVFTLAGGGQIGSTASVTVATGSSGSTAGTATVFYTAPAGTGVAQVAMTATVNEDTIPGAPAFVDEAVSLITVSTGPTPGDKSIVIVGERATVSGKPGIRVDGATKGFDVGSKMVPSIRFPGETEYAAGTARPTTSVAGDFTWQRKTGKKIYVFFTNEAGDVKSNRVIIPAN